MVAAVLVLSVPGTAYADEDPGPVQWPSVEQPAADAEKSDPGPVAWIRIDPPDGTSTGNDPQPTAWPEVEQG